MSHPDHEDDRPEDEPGDNQAGGGPQGGQPQDPFAALLGQLGLNVPGGGPIDLAALMNQLGAMAQQAGAGTGGGIGFQAPGQGGASPGDEWAWLKDQVRKMSASLGPDPTPTQAQRAQVTDSARLAEMWLDEACEFPPVRNPAAVWSRAEWIEATFASWRPLADPVVTALAEALGKAPGMHSEPGEDDPLAMITNMLAPMMRDAARRMYAQQFAQALATLSKSVVSASDVGVQLAEPRIAILASNIEGQFGDLDVPQEDVLLYLTLREAARQRLFQSVAWLGPQLQALVEHYARETRIDLSAIENALDLSDLTQLDPAKLQQIGEQVQGKLFDPDPTPEQAEVLDRLQTLLALVEGWVDHVVQRVAGRWMPAEPALFEAFRRRRGVGGPSEEVFKELVGLELKPRRIRDAANLWAAVENARGQAERDGLWAHPDMLPTAAGLDDPMGFASPQGDEDVEPDEWDRGLQQLLREEGRED
ncbi:zinc-dependent metalloprotease [Aestuariimicrobium sp. Y1814]|uniref:zinc-dependent metalloprotease n=1 Tax=Aestuariimicrobium sp. Y1814 TaxID=3418742 RepID=UPI003DA75A0F